MTASAEFRARLSEERERLLSLVRDLPQEALVRPPDRGSSDDDERWPIRDLLWHVGEQEQRWQRWIEAARRGEQLAGFAREGRPSHASTLPRLLDWITQRRDATLALMAEFAADELDRPHPSPLRGGELSFTQVLGLLSRHDRMHAEQVRSLLDEQGR